MPTSRSEQLRRGEEARQKVLERLEQPASTVQTAGTSARLSRFQQMNSPDYKPPDLTPKSYTSSSSLAGIKSKEEAESYARSQLARAERERKEKAAAAEPPKKNVLERALDAGKKVVDTVNAFNDAGANALTFGLHNRLLKNTGEDERVENQKGLAGGAGRLTGEVLGIGKAYNLAGKALKPLTSRLPQLADNAVAPIVARLSPTAGAAGRLAAQSAGRAVGMAAVGAGAGGLYQTAVEAGEEAFGVNDQTLRQRLGDIGTSTALGAVLDPVAEGYVSAVGRMLQRKPLARVEATAPQPTEPLALPEPKLEAPTRAQLRRQPSLNDVMTEIKPIVTERMTPPYESVDALARWVRQNGFENASLNEIRRLPYEDLRQLADEIRSGMNTYDMAVTVARERGYDLERLLNPRTRSIAPDALQRGRETMRWREIVGQPLVRSTRDRYTQIGQTVETTSARPSRAEMIAQRAGQSQGNLPTAVANDDALLKALDDGKSGRDLRPYLNESEIPFSLDESSTGGSLRRVDETPTNRSADDTYEPKLDPEDDIVVPEPEEIAPRIRDRVNAYADQLIASARAELAASRNRLSSNPVDIYAQYAKVAAGYMLKGTVKLADVTEQLVRDFGEEIRPLAREIFKRAKVQYKAIQKQIETEELGLGDFEGQNLKDLSSLNLNTADVYRNFKKVFGEYYEPIKKAILDPFDEAKGAYAAEQKRLTDKLYNDIVKGLGIRKGSKESALVQQYGEGRINLMELQSAAPDKWEKIVEADKWFRAHYDDLIERVNQTVARIYPNRPEKLVPKRKDYYRHFQELKGWSGLKNLFDTTSTRISPSLAGLSPDTKPKTKWASFKQRRGLGEFTDDAVGGFLDYVPAASYAIHIDPHISSFRNLAKRLAEDTEQTRNLNNFIRWLNNYANDLAGKTSPVDRWVEEIGGRKALQLLTKANNRVKSNVILGNVRSTLSQLANIPNGIAYGGVDAPAGALRTIQSVFQPNEAMAQSKFLRERYLDTAFRRFDQRWWEQPKRFAEAMMEISDRVGTSFVWNTAYAKGVRQGVVDPVKFADEQTRRLVGGRGVGEQPLLIKSKVFNLVAPFQLEVNNLWRVMKDFVDEKRFGALATLFVSNWLLNKAFEKVTGSGVVFDPIDAILDATTEEDLNPLQRGGRVAGEVLSNLPLGQTVASLYPEYGANLYGAELPTRKELFGEKDPTRFGSGLLAADAITDPVFKFILPFGGNQLKKSITGADAIVREGAYTENVLTTGPEIENPKLKFPVARTPENVVRGALFGPFATTEGQEYAELERRPLSERQTQYYLNVAEPLQYYNALMDQRRKETELRKLREVQGQ